MQQLSFFGFLLPILLLPSIGLAQNPVDFELRSATDSSHFTLSKVNGKFVALHFLLKTDCPRCLRHTNNFITRGKELPNVVQIFIKPDSDQDIAAWAENLTDDEVDPYPIYRDPEAALAAQFSIPDGYEFHGQIVHFPAFVLLDTHGVEVYRYVGKDNSDRFSFDQLLTKISELRETSR
ncbi:MAG: redoxin family protein [Saprospiraceae bacterium]|nr:redoxin family protein [Saprospiraceae bacterium]